MDSSGRRNTLNWRWCDASQATTLGLGAAIEDGITWLATYSPTGASSTISRELRRNAVTRGGNLEYRATAAQWYADLRARRPKPPKLATNDRLPQYVQARLGENCKLILLSAPAAEDYYPRVGFRKHESAWIAGADCVLE